MNVILQVAIVMFHEVDHPDAWRIDVVVEGAVAGHIDRAGGTYRFFEAAGAGAIPVVEESCALYDGFVFHTFADEVRSLEWTKAAAEHNAALVRRRLTAPHDELASAVRTELRARA